MEKYVPDIYQQDIYNIKYGILQSRGIKYLIFDLDNTIATIKEKVPSEEVKNLFKDLKKMGFKLFIASNSLKTRVKPFHDELNVNYIYSAKKPHINKINELILENKIGLDEVAMIGDSMMDDIVCGNTIGITTILVDQMNKLEFPFAKLKRIKEHRIQKKLRDKELFTKGRYYV